jgi:hypothetical protein
LGASGRGVGGWVGIGVGALSVSTGLGNAVADSEAVGDTAGTGDGGRDDAAVAATPASGRAKNPTQSAAQTSAHAATDERFEFNVAPRYSGL